jgi:hypothetical protein
MCYMCSMMVREAPPYFSHQGAVRGSSKKMPGCSSDKAATWRLTSTVLIREAPFVRDTESVVTDELSIKKP